MKLKSIILSLLLFGCGDPSTLTLPHIENRIESKVIDGQEVLYDTHLKIYCQSTKGRYILNPAKCIPGLGKVMYSNKECTAPDSIIPVAFLDQKPKYATSSDIGQFYAIDGNARFKGPGLYQVSEWQCIQVLDSVTAYDITEVVSYQIFGDL